MKNVRGEKAPVSSKATQKAPHKGTVRSGGRGATGAVSAQALTAHMGLVHQVVARFLKRLPPNVLRDDLVAAGTIGLIDAVQKSPKATGPTFEWYARIRIRGAILDELRSQDWLSRRARTRVTQEQGRSEVAASQRAHVVGFDDLPPEMLSRLLADHDGARPGDEAEERSVRQMIERGIDQLPERERHIVRMHYFQAVPFKLIAKHLAVSEPRISQLHGRAMQMLRTALEKDRFVA
jgi:RNA polymerase sigma factor for flagellar operon FliA